ncbi:MAG: tetratricopeptide repeat protein [Bryobacteraceae bacterium]|jgi:tetratricopeptide (TPR) repeat protein
MFLRRLAGFIPLLLAAGLQQAQQQRSVTPGAIDVWFQSAVASLAQKNYPEAEKAFRKVYEMDPDNVGALTGLAEVYMAQNRTDEAIKLLEAEAEKNPSRPSIRLALGNVAARAGQYDLALAQFQKALDGTPKNSPAAGDLYLRIGEAYRRKGDLNSATTALHRAKEILPGDATVEGTLALVLENAGQKEEAARVYQAVLAKSPNNSVALNNLAFLLAETGGDLDKALEYAQHARQLVPNLAEFSDTLGWVYLKKKIIDEAIDAFRAAVQKEPSRSTFHYHLALALDQKGDHSAAIEELKTALKNNPSSDEEPKIKELLQKIGG